MNRLTNRSFWLRTALVIAALYLLYILVGLFVLPPLLKWQLPRQAANQINGTVSVERVGFNPFSLALTLDGLTVAGPDGETLAQVERFRINIQAATLLREGFVLREIYLLHPEADLVIADDGSINIAQLVVRQEPGETAGEPDPLAMPRLRLERLQVENGRLGFTDRSRPETFKTTVAPIRFTLNRLDTHPSEENPHLFVAETGAGERIEWQGSFALDPLSARGRLVLEAIDLPHYAPFYQRHLPVTVKAGRFGLTVVYNFAPLADQPELGIIETSASVKDLELGLPDGGETFLTLPEGSISDINASLIGHSVRIGEIASTGLVMRTTRRPDGSIDLLDLVHDFAAADHESESSTADSEPVRQKSSDSGNSTFAEQAGTPDGGTPPGPMEAVIAALTRAENALAADWNVSVERLALSNYREIWRDETLPNTPEWTFGPARLELEGLALPADSDASIRITSEIPGGGEYRMEGSLRAIPLKLDSQVTLSPTLLTPWQPYLARIARAELTGGALEVSGQLSIRQTEEGYAAIAWSGDGRLLDFGLVTAPEGEAEGPQPLASFRALRVAGIQARLDPDLPRPTLSIEELLLETPKGHLRRLEDGSFQPIALLTETGTPADAATPPSRTDDTASEGSEATVTTPPEDNAPAAVAPDPEDDFTDSAGSDSAPGAGAAGTTLDPEAESMPSEDSSGTASDQAPGFAIELPITLRIRRAAILDGSFTFEDRSLQPPVLLRGTRAVAEIANIDSAAPGKATLEGSFTLNERTPLEFRGEAGPFGETFSAEVSAGLKNLDLSPFSPYAEQYIGYGIESGQLTLRPEFTIRERQLDGQLDLTLLRLRLSDEQRNPQPLIQAPVKLGLAVLEGRDGRIRLSPPVSGDLASPEIGIGSIIAQAVTSAIGNTFSKALTSPFSLLGSAFGAGQRNLEKVSFEPGQAELTSAAREDLRILEEILVDRPRLTLAILPGVDEPSDRRALREKILEAKLGSIALPESAAAAETEPPSGEPGQEADRPDGDSEAERRLRALYRQEITAAGSGARTAPVAPSGSERKAEATATTDSRTQRDAAHAPPSEPPVEARRILRRGRLVTIFVERPDASSPQVQKADYRTPTAATAQEVFAEGEIIAPETAESSRKPAAEDEASAQGDRAPAALPTPSEMREALLERIEVGPEALDELARQRGQAVYDFLHGGEGIDPARINLRPPTEGPRSAPEVRFELGQREVTPPSAEQRD